MEGAAEDADDDPATSAARAAVGDAHSDGAAVDGGGSGEASHAEVGGEGGGDDGSAGDVRGARAERLHGDVRHCM